MSALQPCLRCYEPLKRFTKLKNGLYFSVCQHCGKKQHIWQYHDNVCIVDPGESPMRPWKRKRGEPDPRQLGLFGDESAE